MHNLPNSVKHAILAEQAISTDPIAIFVYDLPALQAHIKRLMAALPDKVELFYAIKANSDTAILDTLAPWVDGFEISSGGEISRVASCQQQRPFVFSGPGKLDSELEMAMQQDVAAIHVESMHEIHRLQSIASKLNRRQPVFLRINPSLPKTLISRLMMAGQATPFGIDERDLPEAVKAIDDASHLLLQGFHAHAMSHQMSLDKHKTLIDFYLQRWPHWQAMSKTPTAITHMNVGGGIGVNYTEDSQFDWQDFCQHLDTTLKGMSCPPVLRFEPGRFISAFCGYYGMEILDKKTSHGEAFLVCRGGTHQFRLPVAQNHNHPVIHLPLQQNRAKQPQRWTLVGQLCTPKDVLSRTCELDHCEIGDMLVLPLAGAYGYNISHVEFLCHPKPLIKYLALEDAFTQKPSTQATEVPTSSAEKKGLGEAAECTE